MIPGKEVFVLGVICLLTVLLVIPMIETPCNRVGYLSVTSTGRPRDTGGQAGTNPPTVRNETTTKGTNGAQNQTQGNRSDGRNMTNNVTDASKSCSWGGFDANAEGREYTCDYSLGFSGSISDWPASTEKVFVNLNILAGNCSLTTEQRKDQDRVANETAECFSDIKGHMEFGRSFIAASLACNILVYVILATSARLKSHFIAQGMNVASKVFGIAVGVSILLGAGGYICLTIIFVFSKGRLDSCPYSYSSVYAPTTDGERFANINFGFVILTWILSLGSCTLMIGVEADDLKPMWPRCAKSKGYGMGCAGFARPVPAASHAAGTTVPAQPNGGEARCECKKSSSKYQCDKCKAFCCGDCVKWDHEGECWEDRVQGGLSQPLLSTPLSATHEGSRRSNVLAEWLGTASLSRAEGLLDDDAAAPKVSDSGDPERNLSALMHPNMSKVSEISLPPLLATATDYDVCNTNSKFNKGERERVERGEVNKKLDSPANNKQVNIEDLDDRKTILVYFTASRFKQCREFTKVLRQHLDEKHARGERGSISSNTEVVWISDDLTDEEHKKTLADMDPNWLMLPWQQIPPSERTPEARRQLCKTSLTMAAHIHQQRSPALCVLTPDGYFTPSAAPLVAGYDVPTTARSVDIDEARAEAKKRIPLFAGSCSLFPLLSFLCVLLLLPNSTGTGRLLVLTGHACLWCFCPLLASQQWFHVGASHIDMQKRNASYKTYKTGQGITASAESFTWLIRLAVLTVVVGTAIASPPAPFSALHYVSLPTVMWVCYWVRAPGYWALCKYLGLLEKYEPEEDTASSRGGETLLNSTPQVGENNNRIWRDFAVLKTKANSVSLGLTVLFLLSVGWVPAVVNPTEYTRSAVVTYSHCLLCIALCLFVRNLERLGNLQARYKHIMVPFIALIASGIASGVAAASFVAGTLVPSFPFGPEVLDFVAYFANGVIATTILYTSYILSHLLDDLCGFMQKLNEKALAAAVRQKEATPLELMLTGPINKSRGDYHRRLQRMTRDEACDEDAEEL